MVKKNLGQSTRPMVCDTFSLFLDTHFLCSLFLTKGIYIGLYLGPTSTEVSVQYEVTPLRDTRSFATRFIVASQEINGKARKSFCVTVDFTKKVPSAGAFHREQRLPLSYSVSPSESSFPSPDELDEVFEAADEKEKSGDRKAKEVQALKKTFGLLNKVSDCRNHKGDILDETLTGIVARSDTAQQKAIPDLTRRRNRDYFRSKETLKPAEVVHEDGKGALPMMLPALQASFAGFMLDGALSFYPLTQSGLSLIDAGACSTLDFALRFHDDDYDLQEYHLREMRTYCADRDRTFNEALLWNKDGKLIASMSQQCVLRAKPAKL